MVLKVLIFIDLVFFDVSNAFAVSKNDVVSAIFQFQPLTWLIKLTHWHEFQRSGTFLSELATIKQLFSDQVEAHHEHCVVLVVSLSMPYQKVKFILTSDQVPKVQKFFFRVNPKQEILLEIPEVRSCLVDEEWSSRAEPQVIFQNLQSLMW